MRSLEGSRKDANDRNRLQLNPTTISYLREDLYDGDPEYLRARIICPKNRNSLIPMNGIPRTQKLHGMTRIDK